MAFDESFNFWGCETDARKLRAKLVLLLHRLNGGDLSNIEGWTEVLHLIEPQDIADHYYLSGAMH